MKTMLLILFVALGGMSALYRRFKRVLDESGNADGGSEQQTYGDVDAESEPAYYGDFVYEEPVAQQSPYFTYEAPDVKPPDVKAPKAKSVADSVIIEERLQTKSFDLRQAVIYQTILNNPYIQERNQ